VQSLGYDFFTHTRTIGVRGVDEIDPQFDSATQNTDGPSPICGLAPNTISRDSHGTESQSRYTEIISNDEFASLPCKSLSLMHCGFGALHIVPHFPLRR
jgi:hypothetical protein